MMAQDMCVYVCIYVYMYIKALYIYVKYMYIHIKCMCIYIYIYVCNWAIIFGVLEVRVLRMLGRRKGLIIRSLCDYLEFLVDDL